MHDLDKAIRAAMMTAHRYGNGGKAVSKALDFLKTHPELKPYKGGSFSLERQGVYNPKYFDLKKDDLVDEAGNIIASKHVTVPREGFSYELPAQADPNKIFRGMSAEEFANFQKNKYIQSLGTHNIGEGQKGLTYFSINPDEARSYAHSFAPSEFKPDPSRPAYVVATKRPPDENITRVPGTGESEIGVIGQIPREDVTNVYQGNVVDYIEGIHEPSARVSPSSSVHWEEISDYARGGAIERAIHLARGGYAGGGGAESVLMQEMPTYDPMGNVSVPAFGPAPEQKPIAMENPERVRAAEDAARLAKEIQAFEASKAQIQTQPEWARMMTHAPQEPRAPVQIEGGFIGNRQLGTAPYPVANALSGMAQGAYDFKTAPLYGLGAVFPPAAALGTALDTAEGVAAGSPTQVAMGAFGTPMKAVRNVIAPLTVASGLTAPDEAEAARAPRLGGLSAALSKTAPKAGEMSLEQAMNIAKSIPARELSPLGFYSHGAETAAGFQQAKGTPEQYAAMLQKAGVKPAELEGFGEAFASRPSVTREEIAAHFKERMPQIEETVLGTPKFKDVNEMQTAHDAALERGDTAAANRITQDWEAQFQGNTKFSQYTLPGGENYREVLLKYGETPEAKMERAKSYVRPDIWERMTDEQRQQYLSAPDKGLFKSQHWDDPNVLAHLRMADRTGPNGEKILHVEEIQSDWGQKGKKEGFQGKPPSEKDIEAKFVPPNVPEGHDPTNYPGYWESYDRRTGSFISRHRGGMNEQDVLSEAAKTADLGNRGLIPTAPYVTNTQAWTDLALKRALREAAEGGYDKLVWTPGAEQAKRYDLSKQVRKISYDKNTNSLMAWGHDQSDKVSPAISNFIPEKEIPNYVGKEAAEKLLKSEPISGVHTLAGDDLSIGGEGMKGYYDKIVPNQLSKLVKKLDPEAKIDTHNLVTKRGEKLADEAALNENNQLIEREHFWDEDQGHYVYGYRVTTPEGQELGFFEDLPDAHNALAQALGSAKGPDTILKVPSLTITPKMREAIMKGQTAYARGGTIPFGPEAAQRAVQIAKQQAGRR